MIKSVKKSKLFKIIKPPLVNLYNKMYDWRCMMHIKLHNFFEILFKNTPYVMSIEDSIEYIIDNKCSLSRFGDGEMKIIMGNGLIFQPYSKELSIRLAEILQSNLSNHEIAIPDVFGFLNKYGGEHRVFWEKNMYNNRENWYRHINFNKKYINAFISRCYMNYKNKKNSELYFSLVKKLWENKDIIIIEGEESRLGVGNDLFDRANSIERILAPKEDAFAMYNDILNLAKKLPSNKTIFIALGPTATVLAYDLCKLGYQAIDIGHIDIEYEWYLRNATNKIKIDNKYIMEVEDGDDVKLIDDKKYLSEIKYRVI